MNTTSTLFATGALLLGLGASAAAQTTGKPVDPYPTPTNPPVKTTDTAMSSMHAPATPARASKILGTNIVDTAGDTIGEVKDLVVCDATNEVYACVERKDDMYTCVPLSQLEARFTKSDDAEAKAKAAGEAMSGETPNVKQFVYMGDRASLDSAPAVKDMKMVDGTCVSKSRDHFAGKDVGAMKDTGKAMAGKTAGANERLACAKKLIGQDIKGTDGDKIGDIKDLAIDLGTHKVAYAVVSTGGVLGVGDKLHAVSLDRFTCNEDSCTVAMSKDSLSALPTLDLDRLPSSTAASMSHKDMSGERGTDHAGG
ncbi:MAG TPA: PRC-barrel domain-containing protein [Planctomycetota bacterium]|nr:PRC-barrel domain-containing protein [Planctomycetota bacterium]